MYLRPYSITVTYSNYSKLSVILLPQWNEDTPYIRGGPFEENYIFSRIHFHWGQTINGSEHTVDGVRYVKNMIFSWRNKLLVIMIGLNYRMPLEMHVIHYKKQYLNMKLAKKYDDGLLFLVYFLEVPLQLNL